MSDTPQMDSSEEGGFDESLWPLLFGQLPEAFTDASLEQYLEALSQYLHRGERCVFVLDLVQIREPPSNQRWRMVEWIRLHKPIIGQNLMGTAFVIKAPFLRLTLSTILFFSSPKLSAPYVVVPDRSAGATWAVRRLEEEHQEEAARRVRERYGLNPARASRR